MENIYFSVLVARKNSHTKRLGDAIDKKDMTGFDKISNSIEVLHGLNFSVDPPYYSGPSRLSWWLILLLTLATVHHVTAMVMVISVMVIVTFTIYHIVTITATSVSYIDILLMFINHLR